MDYSAVRASIRTRVQRNNGRSLEGLVSQLRSPLGVIPFFGAGISAKLGYPQWGAFLKKVASDQLNRAERPAVREAVASWDYLRAAGLLAASLGDANFQQVIADEFSDDRLVDEDLTSGLFRYLPLITAGPVITTNFDHVLEQVFERAGRPFGTNRVYGANPHAVIRAVQQNQLVLWKIHGDYDDPRTRVFSDKEYTRHYAELPNLLLLALLNRPALFIGSSLEQDRTTEVLTAVCGQHPATRHYGFLQIPDSNQEFEDRVKALRCMGVQPIWYRKGQFGELENYLADLVHELASVALPKAGTRKRKPGSQVTVKQARASLLSEIDELEASLKSAPPEVREAPSETPPYTQILDKITRGQMAFFLGSGATMKRLPLGPQFYLDLMAQFEEGSAGSALAANFTGMHEAQITQHLMDKYGRDLLYTEVAKQLKKKPNPSAIHWFIATLHSRLKAKGFRPAPQWIFTTNYDDWMEHALHSVGQPFHLFTYRASDPHAGSFVYQRPDGAVHVIDRPSHFHILPQDATVIVKLHGGLHRDINLLTSYVFSQRDFVELGGKMPGVIPRVILDRLAERSMLFLGSGLGDDSIEALARELRRVDPHRLSWAIQRKPHPGKRLYWATLGVQIVDVLQEHFMIELNQRLDAEKGTGRQSI